MAVKTIRLRNVDTPESAGFLARIVGECNDQLTVETSFSRTLVGKRGSALAQVCLAREETGTLINEHDVRFVIIPPDRRPKPFKICYNGVDGGMTRRFATLEEVGKYVRDRWQGEEYADGPSSFHTDYARYTLEGCTLAQIGL